MRTLTSTLLAAQQAASSIPYLRVVVSPAVGAVQRLAWTRYYTGAEPDAYHALCIAGDGALLRSRSGATDSDLQRVVSPGPASDYSAWSAVGVAPGPQALAAGGTDVWHLVFSTLSGRLWGRRSTNYGATWGAWAIVWESGVVTAAPIAAAYGAAGELRVFVGLNGAVYTLQWTSAGGWSAPSSWTNSLTAITGLAVEYQGDWNLIITGTDSPGNRAIWSCIYGDGYSYPAGTWGPLEELLAAGPDSGVSYSWPSATFADTYRISVVESYAGAGGFDRPYCSSHLPGIDFVEGRWREPWPFDASAPYGLSLAFDNAGGTVWAATPGGVWCAPLPAGPDVELTGDVLSARLVERGMDVQGSGLEMGSGQVVVVLRNDDGRYDSAGSGSPGSPLGALSLGARLEVSPGYVTSMGNEHSPGGPAYYLTAIEHVLRDGRAVVEIRAEDGWKWLAEWRARRSLSFASGSRSVFQLVSTVVARAGFGCAGSGALSALISSYSPAYHLPPGGNGAAAVRTLLAAVGEVGFWRGATLMLRQMLDGDAGTYDYGGAGEHPICAARTTRAVPAANQVRVIGPAALGEAIDFTDLELALDRAMVRHDPYGNATDMSAAASGLLRRATVLTPAGEIEVPVNCGQELWDVVMVTAPRAGLGTATARRVIGLRLEYERGRGKSGKYRHFLTLGGV